VLNKK